MVGWSSRTWALPSSSSARPTRPAGPSPTSPRRSSAGAATPSPWSAHPAASGGPAGPGAPPNGVFTTPCKPPATVGRGIAARSALASQDRIFVKRHAAEPNRAGRRRNQHRGYRGDHARPRRRDHLRHLRAHPRRRRSGHHRRRRRASTRIGRQCSWSSSFCEMAPFVGCRPPSRSRSGRTRTTDSARSTSCDGQTSYASTRPWDSARRRGS